MCYCRRNAVGDTLRATYDQLSRDPNSLANLDQDLPNYAQHQVPIFSLPQEWLWCESWCSDESKSSVSLSLFLPVKESSSNVCAKFSPRHDLSFATAVFVIFFYLHHPFCDLFFVVFLRLVRVQAKTIDLCNNPLHKEPKLEMARRCVKHCALPLIYCCAQMDIYYTICFIQYFYAHLTQPNFWSTLQPMPCRVVSGELFNQSWVELDEEIRQQLAQQQVLA